jgi:hypothetical protein
MDSSKAGLTKSEDHWKEIDDGSGRLVLFSIEINSLI